MFLLSEVDENTCQSHVLNPGVLTIESYFDHLASEITVNETGTRQDMDYVRYR